MGLKFKTRITNTFLKKIILTLITYLLRLSSIIFLIILNKCHTFINLVSLNLMNQSFYLEIKDFIIKLLEAYYLIM